MTSEAPCWKTIGVWKGADKSCPRLRDRIHCRNCEEFSRQGRRLFERPAPEDYLAEWEKRLANEKDRFDRGASSALVFRVGDQLLSIPLNALSEVVGVRFPHPIPHQKDPAIRGLINLNGRLQLCASLHGLFKLPDDAPGAPRPKGGASRRIIVMSSGEDSWAFAVDEVLGVYTFEREKLIEPPATLPEATRLVAGSFLLNGEEVGVLDDAALTRRLNGSLR